MTCIICRKSVSPLSDEHVIPESLGGYYHIYNVCITCNSKLGNKVDEPLTNHVLAKFFRLEHQIKGKTGHLPNPLNNDAHLVINEEKARRVRSKINKNGKIDMILVPEVNLDIVDDSLLINVDVDPKEINEIGKILHKAANRAGYKIKESIDVSKIVEKNIENSHITCSINIDTHNYKFGLLKIAYEFGCDKLDNYLNDKQAIKISSLLKRFSYQESFKSEEVNDYIKGNILEENNIFKCFPMLDKEKPRHYLLLVYLENIGTVCFISLYKVFFAGVLLSIENYLKNDDFHIIINDFENHSFSTVNNEIVKNNTTMSFTFGYKINHPHQKEILENCRYRHKGVIKGIPSLYNSKGEILYEKFDDYCLKNKKFSSELSSNIKNEKILVYSFPEEIYVKTLDNHLIQVGGVKVYYTLPIF